MLDKGRKDTISCHQGVHSLVGKIRQWRKHLKFSVANARGNNYCTDSCGYPEAHNPTRGKRKYFLE